MCMDNLSVVRIESGGEVSAYYGRDWRSLGVSSDFPFWTATSVPISAMLNKTFCLDRVTCGLVV
jgi:hypothetical protein